jgi:hypothetical protein
MFWVELVVSSIMGTIGAYFLYRGKKIQEPKMMLWGAVLIVLSYFLFSAGGGKDDSTKNALKILMPGVAGQEQMEQPQQPTPSPQTTEQPTPQQ